MKGKKRIRRRRVQVCSGNQDACDCPKCQQSRMEAKERDDMNAANFAIIQAITDATDL